MNSNFYIHNSDKKALQALKAVPGFDQLLKAFMKFWDEKLYRVENMATNLRLSENQLSKYYEMLPPICEKLGIDIPELYLKDAVDANAWTAGDTKPFIVITKGLLETFPDELIPSVLAHECGHIACHHCLYTTMARIILDESAAHLPFAGLIMPPIKLAFAYWMRCSELSADRAAAICDGTADKVIKNCMYFAGYDKDIEAEANVDEFVKQALDYREMVKNEKMNKAMEFALYRYEEHPLNAVRALECKEWAETENFAKIAEYTNINRNKKASLSEYLQEAPMPETSKYYIGKNISEVFTTIQELGFKNVKKVKITQKGILVKEGQVINIRINGKDGFDMCEWYNINAEILIEYYEAETADEIAAAHPNQIRCPNSSKYYLGKLNTTVIDELQKSGLKIIECEEQKKTKKGLLNKNGEIANISINGQTQFAKNEWFDKNAKIKITYYTYEK